MEMLGQTIVGALGLCVVVLQTLRPWRGISRERRLIKHEAEVVNLLPDCPARERLLEHIDDAVAKILALEKHARRDFVSMTQTAATAVSFGLIIAYLVAQRSDELKEFGGTVVILVISAAGLLAAVGMFFESSQKALRNDRGNRISEDRR